ncbi:MAG: aldolase catalytic domain-containing protein [Gammaproteobacteria bacterium]|nr:aldolase catalytic domain-containing protein [Gammaproteobacteria bacterium]MBU2064344.1 aldolase catalytic domain-containing protein [Gammaproteobacteria bacterium]MBU2179380.1 aldolase catalytic domain-containing protein [Gammaproteobacteria bacterium]MBU2255564.1 aldolase catalytic domain-containing protein [Gammaproteobacteria bacterium]MBU2321684.1 aldolase catalytic domain-containing protein [Gammaproteobacteria bacterium]
MKNHPILLLDCTLRDGGYYNSWDFSRDLIDKYLNAMHAAGVDIVELGLRSLKNEGFKGACAFTTDGFIRSLDVPQDMKVSVMVNAVELLSESGTLETCLELLFPEPASSSPVSVVRIACHVHEFSNALPASRWLKERGFTVGFNLMQIADRAQCEIEQLSLEASKWPLDTLYFADSMGSMNPLQVAEVIGWLRTHWDGPLGIHTHDNMGMALQNTLRSIEEGVTWVDATVTGMGRGPGNAKTECLALEVADKRSTPCNMVPLMALVQQTFLPMQHKCGWGSNTYYYLAGKYGIHPTYIQEMMSDSRYSEEDILAVIARLRIEGGKKFSFNALDDARNFYQGPARGTWQPAEAIKGREVLLLGTGPGVANHQKAIEAYIQKTKPYVIALNTQSLISANLIDACVACHPVRLLADCDAHTKLPQPLITPSTMLPQEVRKALTGKVLLDFGLKVELESFDFKDSYAVIPTSLVIAYALAVAASGKASLISLAGFDGYKSDDPRNQEMNKLFKLYSESLNATPLTAITPTRYDITVKSVYAFV